LSRYLATNFHIPNCANWFAQVGTPLARQSGFTSRNGLADDGTDRDRHSGTGGPEQTSRRIKHVQNATADQNVSSARGDKGRTACLAKLRVVNLWLVPRPA